MKMLVSRLVNSMAIAGLAASISLLAGPVRAEVRPHPLFSDGMVLQRGASVPVWGTADPGARVTVKIQDQEAQATADDDGKWMARLKDLKAGGPFTLTIAEKGKDKETGQNALTIEDVLVGEVWLCSGQSNMAMALNRCEGAERDIAGSKDPMLRLYTVPRTTSNEPLRDMESPRFPLRRVRDAWKEAGPRSSATFSAVAYYFGRDLRKALGVPVGLIHSSVGGTPAEAWTPRAALKGNPALQDAFAADARSLDLYPRALEQYKARLEAHKAAVARARKNGEQPPRAPRAPYGPDSTKRPSVLYNAMIAPLEPYAIRGALWYQGEGNAGRAYQYQTLLSAMIRSWRAAWGEGDFPFLIVQLAPYMKINETPGESAWAELREAQLKTSQSVPNSALAVITDVGDENDIHPRRKGPVGARLALAARDLVYGEDVESSGPVFKKMDVEGDRAILHFTHTGAGLVARDGPLKGFTIAGKDRKFVEAEAKIEGDTVVVRSDDVAHPVAVRYGWANYPLGNLWNKDDLPATPFRTDDFPMSTRPQGEQAAEVTTPVTPEVEPKAGGKVEEVTYKKTPQGDLSLFIHRPEDWKETDKRPAIVFFFGGGWTNGRPTQFESQADYLAGRGLVTVRADYRVKSRHQVQPDACVEDAKSAVRWLRAHAKQYGIDPDRIVAAGGSAGAHIAACTATIEGFDAEGEDRAVSSKPNALVLYNPVLLLEGPSLERYFEDPALGPKISPTLGVTASLPPTLLLYGTKDRLAAQAGPFMDKAKDAGARVELFEAEGVGHGFFNRAPWTARTTKRVDEFLSSLGYLHGAATIVAP